jgi:hypothetical protein
MSWKDTSRDAEAPLPAIIKRCLSSRGMHARTLAVGGGTGAVPPPAPAGRIITPVQLGSGDLPPRRRTPGGGGGGGGGGGDDEPPSGAGWGPGGSTGDPLGTALFVFLGIALMMPALTWLNRAYIAPALAPKAHQAKEAVAHAAHEVKEGAVHAAHAAKEGAVHAKDAGARARARAAAAKPLPHASCRIPSAGLRRAPIRAAIASAANLSIARPFYRSHPPRREDQGQGGGGRVRPRRRHSAFNCLGGATGGRPHARRALS